MDVVQVDINNTMKKLMETPELGIVHLKDWIKDNDLGELDSEETETI